MALDPQHKAAQRGLQFLSPEQTAPSPTVGSSSAGAVTARLTLPDDFAFPPAAPMMMPQPAPDSSSAGTVTARLTLPDDFAFPPVASPIVSPPLGVAAEQEAAKAFVVRELGQFRRRDEIIRRLAERQQWSWDDARQFLSRVEITESDRIARGRRRFWLMIGGVALLGVIAVVGLVVALLAFLPASSDTATTTFSYRTVPLPWRSYLVVAAGIFTILGALLDWDWFMYHPHARFFVTILGRTGMRVFYILLGYFLLILDLFLYWAS